MHMPSRVFDIFQELFELIQDTPRTIFLNFRCSNQKRVIKSAMRHIRGKSRKYGRKNHGGISENGKNSHGIDHFAL